jgi:hypothetical protein
MDQEKIGDREANWAVYRLDDNGNRFVVETGLTKEAAEELVAEFQSRGHKQLYWAEVQKSNRR